MKAKRHPMKAKGKAKAKEKPSASKAKARPKPKGAPSMSDVVNWADKKQAEGDNVPKPSSSSPGSDSEDSPQPQASQPSKATRAVIDPGVALDGKALADQDTSPNTVPQSYVFKSLRESSDKIDKIH